MANMLPMPASHASMTAMLTPPKMSGFRLPIESTMKVMKQNVTTRPQAP